MTSNFIINDLNDYYKNMMNSVDMMNNIQDIEIGTTPKKEVYSEDKLVLYKYESTTTKNVKTPLLISYALVNRPYMMDLQPDRSTIKNIIESGVDVYLIDWGYPDYADRYINLDDYINGYIDNCVEYVKKAHAIDKINLLGVCQGGTFSICYSSLYPEKINALITMVTPVDFHTPDNLVSMLSRNVDVDAVVDLLGNIPGNILNDFFASIKPMMLNLQKMVDMPNTLSKINVAENFLRMEKWINDSPDQAGEAYKEFLKWFFQENKLIKNEVYLGGKQVNLKNINMPVLNVYATKDHLVPPSSSIVLKDYISTKNYEELSFDGGHIGIYVSSKAQEQIPPNIVKWLKKNDI